MSSKVSTEPTASESSHEVKGVSRIARAKAVAIAMIVEGEQLTKSPP